MTVVGPSLSRSDIIRSSPSREAILRDDIIKCSSAAVVQPNQHVEEGSAARFVSTREQLGVIGSVGRIDARMRVF